jgi:copper chaperone CopZ
MKRLTLSVPAMYADHHVLRVREALAGQKGVQEMVASSARKKVTVDYDESVTSAAEIEQTLARAGYALDRSPQIPLAPKQTEDSSAWYTVMYRVTKTEMKDREMAGDFRRY